MKEYNPISKRLCIEKICSTNLSNIQMIIGFSENVSSFLKFLSESVNHLPGPIIPNTRYYEARSRGLFKNNNR